MKCVITGGAGFIGSHLCEKLLNAGEEVICVDNLFTGKKENILHLLPNKRFTFIEHDITEPLHIPYKIDLLCNLACPASPIHYQHDAIKTVKTNVLGTINMLELCKLHKAVFLQASTSEVYGDPEMHPQVETYFGNVNPISIRACYDEGKRCAETLCFDYMRRHWTDIRIARIFNTYGPRMTQNDGRVISNFIVQALKNEDITIYGDGSQTRSFCFVDDLIEGLYLLIKSNSTGPINLGNPEEYSIGEIANKIIELTQSKSKIIYVELPEGDPKRRKPDITVAKTKLNWQPKINVNDGLIKTVEYFKDQIHKK